MFGLTSARERRIQQMQDMLTLPGLPEHPPRPKLPSTPPPVILPKELLVHARKLEPQEIEAAVTKAVQGRRAKPSEADLLRQHQLLMNRYMMALT